MLVLGASHAPTSPSPYVTPTPATTRHGNSAASVIPWMIFLSGGQNVASCARELGLAVDHEVIRAQAQAPGLGHGREGPWRRGPLRVVKRMLDAPRLLVGLEDVEIRRRELDRVRHARLPLFARAVAAEHDTARAPGSLVIAADLDDEVALFLRSARQITPRT